MPGKQVKNWDQYEALRAEGYSKESAARITNASYAKHHGSNHGRNPRKRKGKA